LTAVIPRVQRVIGLGSGCVIYDGQRDGFTDIIKSKVYGADLNSEIKK
jgi:ABC-type phosphate/phosphonate transport system ATPase subunit